VYRGYLLPLGVATIHSIRFPVTKVSAFVSTLAAPEADMLEPTARLIVAESEIKLFADLRRTVPRGGGATSTIARRSNKGAGEDEVSVRVRELVQGKSDRT
jgi:hypothetical protein